MSKKVIIIGGEGNGGVVASCIEDNNKRFNDNEYEVYGFLNDFLTKNDNINGYPVLGGITDASNFFYDDIFFIWAIHMIGKGPLRENLFKKVNIPLNRFARIIHKTAFIAHNAILEPGVFIMSNCYIGPATKIGYCTLIMANSLIGHNTEVGPLCHFSVGSITSSYIKIGKSADVTLGAKVIEKVKMGDYSVAGAASLVLKDIPPKEVHVGIPAKFSRMIKEE